MPHESFTDWFNAQGFRHFSAGEFTRYFARERKGVKNSPPPRMLWKNLTPTLRVVDDLRQHLGKPCRILSSYRSPDYNKAVGGAVLSKHVDFNALDIAFEGISAGLVYAVLIAWRKDGRFKGGLGFYPSSGFVHIDTRGSNTTWKGK